MSNEEDQQHLISGLVSSGDAWLREYGIITPMMHNNIVLNLRMHFPKAKDVDYFMNPDEKTIHVRLFLTPWGAFTSNTTKMIDSAINLVSQYLTDYKVTAEIKRFKKMENSTPKSV